MFLMKRYSISNLNGFANSIRDSVAKSFSEHYTENLDDFISIAQVISLVKKYSLGTDLQSNYIISDRIFDKIFDSLREWLYGVGLAKLASKGQLECAWDDDSNEMIFWLPDKNQTSISTKPSNYYE